MDVATILATAGVAALLAAIVGGGLKGGGWEIGALKSRPRQIGLGVAGVVLIGISLALTGGTNPFASAPSVTGSINPGIDFRSSNVADSFQLGTNGGYLVMVTSVRVRNNAGSSRPVTWEGTDAILTVGDRNVPFQAYYFYTGDLNRAHWFGEGRTTAEAVTITPGQTAQRDIVFMPDNAGQGAYQWDEFVRFVLSGRGDAVVRFTVRLSDGVDPIPMTCSARADQYVDAVRQRAAITQRSEPNLMLNCRRAVQGRER